MAIAGSLSKGREDKRRSAALGRALAFPCKTGAGRCLPACLTHAKAGAYLEAGWSEAGPGLDQGGQQGPRGACQWWPLRPQAPALATSV